MTEKISPSMCRRQMVGRETEESSEDGITQVSKEAGKLRADMVSAHWTNKAKPGPLGLSLAAGGASCMVQVN
jgi:hypothetical protein